MEFKYKTVAEINAMSADEQEKYLAEKKTHDDNERKKELENAVKTALEPLTKSNADLKKDVKDLSDNVNQVQEELKLNREEVKESLRSVVKENYETIKNAFKKDGGETFKPFEIGKVAAMHMTNNGTISNAVGVNMPLSPNFEVDNEISFIRIPENFILNVIRNSVRTKVPEQITKMQELASEGAVAVTAEGTVKPLIQKKFRRTVTTRQKYSGRIEWTEEFEMDFEALLDAIIDMLERDVIIAWQDGILDIIETNATTYLGSSLDGTLVKPDNGLAVIAAAQQIRMLLYNPNYVFMNPSDIDAAVYTQDTEGNFSLKPYIDANGNRIGGLTVIPSLKIAEGEAIVGDFSIYKEIHSRIIMRKGQYNAQFIENEYTMVAEVFSILSASPADYPAIVKINLATVKAALEIAP